MSIRVHAIAHEDDQRKPLPEEARVVAFRDLAAVVVDAPYVAQEPDDDSIARHARIVAAAFENGEVVPLPPGTIFRTEAALRHWMELHYVALSDALAYVADRVGARVHITSVDSHGEASDSGNDLAATAAELMRALRRRAVATLPLEREHTTGIAIGMSFLVERSLWREFQDELQSVAAGRSTTQVRVTGPWPPYDFINVDLGA